MTRDLMGVLDPILERVHRGHCWIKTEHGPRRIDEPLTPGHVSRHLTGRAAFGACPLAPGSSTTQLALFDLDSHKGETPWPEMAATARKIIETAAQHYLYGIPFRSSGGSGIHVFFLWTHPQDAYSVRQQLAAILAECGLKPGTAGVAQREVELFPKQDRVPEKGFGSMFILPLAGKSNRLDREAFTDLPKRLATRWEWPMSDSVTHLEKPVREPLTPRDPTELKTLRDLLAKIPNETDSLDYDRWRNVIFAIHHATEGSDEGLELAHEFSARSPKYDPDFLDTRVWPYITADRDNPVTIDSLRFIARSYEDPLEDFEDLGPLPEEPAAVDGAPLTRFRVLSEDDLLAVPRPQWIVKGVVPKAELGVIYGASGSGKSFLALDLFAAVARGVTWRGLKVRQASVVYVAAEGQGGFRNRLEAYKLKHETSSHLKVILDGPNLLKADAKPLAAQIVAAGGAGVIVIDTLAQVSPGGDENSAEDMGRVLLSCRYLHRATGALIILIHHAGKDLTKGARGWSGLKAAADVEIEINRLDNDRWMRVTKSKDGEDGAEYPFQLTPVVLGKDEEGDDITSCTIEHQERQARSEKREPKGRVERMVWRAAHEMCELGGAAVPVEGLISQAAKNLPHDPQAGRDRRREYVKQALLALAERGFLTIVGDEVEVASNDS